MLPFWFFKNTNCKIFNNLIWDKLPHKDIFNISFHNSIDQQSDFFETIKNLIPLIILKYLIYSIVSVSLNLLILNQKVCSWKRVLRMKKILKIN